MSYKLLDRILGWVVFAIAAFVYLSTIEPTTSFWDCGEYIATSYKLEVGHPPGAPFFMLIARIFSIFAFGAETEVAAMVNSMSALASAFTIMFLFWTITHLSAKFFKSDNFDTGQTIAVLGSGLVGALAFTFTDTFWFSAVEGEVYALSSLFTAVVFWAILKWENIADSPYANRWLILIAYLIGLSIGVHLLNLLAVPSIMFVYYFRKYKTTTRGFVYTLLLSIGVLAILMYGIVQGLIKIGAKFELFFVNTLGLPFDSGIIFFLALLAGLLAWFIYSTYIHKKVLWNTILTGFAMILIGYSSFAMILIRSNANPPIDENNPENVFSFMSYLQREQYGSKPLFYGHYYNAPVEDRGTQYTYIKDQRNGEDYYKKGRKASPDYTYNSQFETIFPRMYSSQRRHIQAYKEWGTIDGKPVEVKNRKGKTVTKQKPTFFDNIEFFVRYQVGHMYVRYFMWNFAGRQNNIQGHGGSLKGNWLSGIDFIDELRLGSQDNLPGYLKNHKARNTYYFLPLILGLIGLVFSYKKDIKLFWLVLLLFILTGFAIVVYLNQTPYQPRERDYAYAGSYYAFAIWIGFGVLAIYDGLKKLIRGKISAILATLIPLILVPGILAAENWNDHDRSGRYTARDFARNYLDSCEENAILFTFGDNDTFPLWYVQEVEGYRTDVRVVNLSLLGTDWYITQMKRKAYDSPAVPFSFTKDQYVQGKRDIVPIVKRMEKYYNLEEVMNFVGSNESRTKLRANTPNAMNYIPTKKFTVPVDSAKVVNNGTVPKEHADRIVDQLRWKVNKQYLSKSHLMILDLLAHFDWERPVYFATSIGQDYRLGLDKYLRQEGFAHRLVPYKAQPFDGQLGEVDAETMYENMMNEFSWGRMNKPDVLIDGQNTRTIRIMGIRGVFDRLAGKLNQSGKHEKAEKVLDKCMHLMPHEKIPFRMRIGGIVQNYYDAGATEKANKLARKVVDISRKRLAYYTSLSPGISNTMQREKRMAFGMIRNVASFADENGQSELYEEFSEVINEYRSVLSN